MCCCVFFATYCGRSYVCLCLVVSVCVVCLCLCVCVRFDCHFVCDAAWFVFCFLFVLVCLCVLSNVFVRFV